MLQKLVPYAVLGNACPARQPLFERLRRALTLFATLMLCAGLAQAENSRGGTTIWVGNDVQCDTSSLAQALGDANNGDTIRVASNRSYNNAPYSINNSIRLIGGYPECQSSQTDTNTGLSGGFSDRVLQVFHPNAAVNLDIEVSRIDVAAGSATGNGGGLSIDTNHSVLLSDTNFSFNSSDASGGAISVGPGSVLELSGDNDISINSADIDGGGIACLDGTVNINQGAAIRSNSAENGGGIHADGCTVRLYSGGPGFQGIRDNEASGTGGGIAATNGAQLLLDGTQLPNSNPALPVVVSGNSGPGISLILGANAQLINTIVANNVSQSGTAGIFVGGSASLDMRADLEAPCRDLSGAGPRSCSSLRGNVSEEQLGSIVRGHIGSEIEIRQTEIRENIIDAGGIVRVGRGSLLLENTLIADNETSGSALSTYIIRVSNTDDAFIRWSTIANHQGTTTNDVLIDMFAFEEDDSTQIGLEGLVVDQPGATVIQARGDGNSELSRAACIVAPEIDSMEALASSTAMVGLLQAADPMLVDPDNGNYRLSAGSPAVDGCMQTTQPQHLFPPAVDIDGFNRGLANSEEGQDSPFDLGAFERLGEILLHDRFEQN